MLAMEFRTTGDPVTMPRVAREMAMAAAATT